MDEPTAWDLYFSGVVAFACHPGFQREGTEKPTIEQCANIADQMLAERRRRWDGLQQPQQ